MARLYSFVNEEVRTVPDEEVTQLVLDGSHSFLKGDKVHVKDRTGKVFEIPTEKAHFALQEGLSYAGAKDLERIRLKNFVKDRPGTAATLGLLRSLSFGYSDQYLQDIGVSKEAIKAYRDSSSGVPNIIGEVAGIVPKLSPVGGAGIIGKAMVKKALKGPKLDKIGLPTLAGGATEGAIVTTPLAVSENILEDKPNLSSEQIMAGAGFGATAEGIIGLLQKGGGFLGKKGKTLADYLYYRSTGARTPEYKKLTRFGGNRDRVYEIGRRLRDLQKEGKIKSLSDHEEILETLQSTLIPETGAGLNTILNEIKKVQGKQFLVDTKSLADKMEAQFLSNFKDASGNLIPVNQLPKPVRALYNKAKAEIDEIRNLPPQDFFALETQKRLYSKLKNWTKPPPGTSVSDGMDRIYGGMAKVLREESESVLENLQGTISQIKDKGLFEKFKQYKKDYGDLADLEMLMSASVRRDAVNNMFGLTSMNLGAGLGAGGIAAGDTLLQSLGGGATGLLAGTVLRKLARDKGELLVARGLDSLMDMSGALGNLSRSQNIIAKSVRGLVKGTVKGVPVIAARTYPDRLSLEKQGKTFDKMRDGLEEIMANPGSLYATVEKAFPSFEGNDKIQGALIQGVSRAVQFLYEKLPKNPLAGMELTIPEKPYTPNPAEVSKFFRFEEIVNEPLKAFGHLINGTFTPEHREALISVYPELYKNMQEEILKGLAEGKPDMSLPQKIQLSIFMGKPVDPTMTYLRDFQMSYMDQEGEGFRPKDRKIQGLKDQAQTDIERVS
jgi:hypothetical protein